LIHKLWIYIHPAFQLAQMCVRHYQFWYLQGCVHHRNFQVVKTLYLEFSLKSIIHHRPRIFCLLTNFQIKIITRSSILCVCVYSLYDPPNSHVGNTRLHSLSRWHHNSRYLGRWWRNTQYTHTHTASSNSTFVPTHFFPLKLHHWFFVS